MKQFILNTEPDKNGAVRLEGDDYRYLVRVRRLAVGEYFPALLPGGGETLVQVTSIENDILTGKCITASPVSSSGKAPRIILLQALPKGEKMDLIARQAAEGGLVEVVPFVSEFSIAKINTGGQKFSRWQRIIKEARQQSGSAVETAIRRPLTIDGLFDYWKTLLEEGAAGLFFHHQPLAQESLHSYLNNVPPVVALAIGPEGGFSDNEVKRFMEAGFKPLTIGDTILRTETAALYAAAAIRVLILERNSWELK